MSESSGQGRGKGLSHIIAQKSIWTHFCCIALLAEPNIFQRKKLAAKRQKEKWAKNTIEKEFPHFTLLIF